MSDFRPGAELEQGLVSIGGGIGREAHDSEHLREAVRVTARGDGDRVEIQLGHFCNNRCVFCVSGQLTEQKLAPRIELEPIVAALEAAAERGVRRVTFLGGEPTIQPSFQPALERAVALDFEEIVIFTNGVRTWKAPFMEHVVSLGRFTWRFSLQGGDEETHDRVVGRRGAFERIRRGMLWLSERQQDITVNMCVNGHSYRSLPLFPELLVGRGPRQLHVDTVRPNGAGVRSEQELDGLLVPYSDMAPFFEAMLQGFSELDPSFEVHVGNLPYCVLPGWTAWLHHGGEATATVTTDNRGKLARVWNKYEYQRTGMVYGEDCGACAFRDRCRGVPREYAARHGTAELVALSEEQLRRSDEQARALRALQRRPADRGESQDDRRELLKILARVRDLRARAPFGGWRWGGVHRPDGGQSVLVTLLGPGEQSFELELSPGRAEFRLAENTSEAEAREAVEQVARALV